MKKSLLVIFCTLFGLHVFGQGLAITSGEKVKNFKPGSWYNILVEGKAVGGQPCDHLEYTGTISRISGDSITLLTGKVTIRSVVESTHVEQSMLFAGQRARTTFAVEDMVGLQHYKSEKAQKTKKTFGVVGGLLMFTGAITALNGFFVKDASNREGMLIAGGIQIGAGLTLALSSSSKKYYFRDKEEVWKVVAGK
ncbi:MAG: hypothetical protein IT270_00990 [Saprospiraceae bacterium]|nr:hypothetical protein [Saprospiraceae bacterium]